MEFVNYRKWSLREQRLHFSERVRREGLGKIPIVVDSVDADLTDVLCGYIKPRHKEYGYKLVMHMDATVEDVLREVYTLLIQKGEVLLMDKYKLSLGLEDGTIPDVNMNLGVLYKEHRNKDDKILYLLLTKEVSVYKYVLSILRYIKRYLFSWRN